MEKFRSKAVKLSKKIRHRGPDWSGVKISGNNVLCHERLSIVGVESGAQPLTNDDESIVLSVNGEIYNHVTLRKRLTKTYQFKTASDCEYLEYGDDCVQHLDGMFSFILYDAKKDRYLVARDHVGITTLYQGWRSSDKSVWFASEMKSLNEDCDKIISFPPGHIYTSDQSETTEYYHPAWFNDIARQLPVLEDELKIQTEAQDQRMYTDLRNALEKSVMKRLMSDVPYGVLLSGGLDSSLIASIAVRLHRNEQDLAANDDDDVRCKLCVKTHIPAVMSTFNAWPKLHSFSIGLPGSPDLVAAQKVAEFLGTVHHSLTFTVQEGLDAIEEVIHHLETYDVTTVRASTPMYLLSRKIKAMGVKMVLSGEGSDEIFGGYLYFHNAPTAQALHHECIQRVQNLHTSDNLRANKSTMAWGLEARVPFLDKEFLDVAMQSVPANHKMSKKAPYNHYLEKYVLRKAFDNKEDPYLPHEILWRQKEQFSDGVGYSWIDKLKDYTEDHVSDDLFALRAERFAHDTPTTKEAYWYRSVFERHFPQAACLETVVRWVPRKDWGCNEDPSGRAQTVHLKAYGNNENNIVSGSDTKSPLQNGKSKDVDAISAKDGLVSHPSKRVKQL